MRYALVTFKLRAQIVWQNLQKVLSQTGITPSAELSSELKQEVLKYSEAIYTEASDKFQYIAGLVGIPTGYSMPEARERALAKVTAEIDLFSLSLTRRAEAQNSQSAPIVNFYSPVGTVQTGPNATANVVQNINPVDKEVLLRALDAVKQGIASIDRLPVYPKQEIIELVDEAHVEVGKPTPNVTKLGAIMFAVATAIQTVGSLQPAYQTLKDALIPFGIQLP